MSALGMRNKDCVGIGWKVMRGNLSEMEPLTIRDKCVHNAQVRVLLELGRAHVAPTVSLVDLTLYSSVLKISPLCQLLFYCNFIEYEKKTLDFPLSLLFFIFLYIFYSIIFVFCFLFNFISRF
jgi:hypothetical protein